MPSSVDDKAALLRTAAHRSRGDAKSRQGQRASLAGGSAVLGAVMALLVLGAGWLWVFAPAGRRSGPCRDRTSRHRPATDAGSAPGGGRLAARRVRLCRGAPAGLGLGASRSIKCDRGPDRSRASTSTEGQSHRPARRHQQPLRRWSRPRRRSAQATRRRWRSGNKTALCRCSSRSISATRSSWASRLGQPRPPSMRRRPSYRCADKTEPRCRGKASWTVAR